jgi:hypothetical protein
MIEVVDDIARTTDTEAGSITGAHDEEVNGTRCLVRSIANRAFDEHERLCRLF